MIGINGVTSTDTDIAFSKVARGQKPVGLDGIREIVLEIARKVGKAEAKKKKEGEETLIAHWNEKIIHKVREIHCYEAQKNNAEKHLIIAVGKCNAKASRNDKSEQRGERGGSY